MAKESYFEVGWKYVCVYQYEDLDIFLRRLFHLRIIDVLLEKITLFLM
jgi:hypothetical protein